MKNYIDQFSDVKANSGQATVNMVKRKWKKKNKTGGPRCWHCNTLSHLLQQVSNHEMQKTNVLPADVSLATASCVLSIHHGVQITSHWVQLKILKQKLVLILSTRAGLHEVNWSQINFRLVSMQSNLEEKELRLGEALMADESWTSSEHSQLRFLTERGGAAINLEHGG